MALLVNSKCKIVFILTTVNSNIFKSEGRDIIAIQVLVKKGGEVFPRHILKTVLNILPAGILELKLSVKVREGIEKKLRTN